MAHIHKNFSNEEVKKWFKRYEKKEVNRETVCDALSIGRSRFFALLKKYRENPDAFSISYCRKSKNRIPAETIQLIKHELDIDKKLIRDKAIPIFTYNYSFVTRRLQMKHNVTVLRGTVTRIAKKHGYYKPRRKKKKLHDREVYTDYIGELIQHDSSYHLFAPDAQKKWHLISSLDDHSRFILYAKLVEKETSWEHIMAVKDVILRFGTPLRYYSDSHSIFRFVQGRDSNWRKHHVFTDERETQWQKVLTDCNVKVTHALSPQAKGKVERSYRWIQDNLVRLCVREAVTNIAHAQRLLDALIEQYNNHNVHATTGEAPATRLERCQRKRKSLFRRFKLKAPFKSVDDIFALRVTRMVNAYRKISLNDFEMKIPNAPLRTYVELRVSLNDDDTASVRIWAEKRLVDKRTVLKKDLKL